MTKLRKNFALGAIAFLVTGSALAFGAPKVARASGSCFFNYYPKEYYDFMKFPDNNYVDMTLGIWQVPPSGCTEWAGHHYGNVELSALFQLGTTQDYFTSSSNTKVDLFGTAEIIAGDNGYPDSLPVASGSGPFYIECADLGNGWVDEQSPCVYDSGASSIWTAPTGTVGGTNGNTSIEFTTSVLAGTLFSTPCTDHGTTWDWQYEVSLGDPGYYDQSGDPESSTLALDGGTNRWTVPYSYLARPSSNSWTYYNQDYSC